MAQKRHSVDEIISKLRRADVELGKGKKVSQVCNLTEIAEQCITVGALTELVEHKVSLGTYQGTVIHPATIFKRCWFV